MRAQEFLREDSAAATTSAAVATVAQPLLTQSRSGVSTQSGKYTTDPDSVTDQQKGTRHVVRQFKNSIGH